jgi:AraC-like DNA-binding protein
MKLFLILRVTRSIQKLFRSIRLDRLAPFFSRFTLSARVFFSGQLCGISGDHASKTVGHLHVLRSGTLTILQPGSPAIVLSEPTVLLFPRPGLHTFRTEAADILCAFVDFGAGMLNPLAAALPPLLQVPLISAPVLDSTIDLLFAEAFDQKDGRQVAVDCLAEYFLVLLLRFALEARLLKGGLLTALSDAQLSRALSAFHREPEKAWTLEELAHLAGMSRARFAAHFLAVMGQTAFEYLTLWRIGVAQALLKKGEPLKMVAPTVGYASAGALNRAFSQHVGLSPMAWMAAQESLSRKSGVSLGMTV